MKSEPRGKSTARDYFHLNYLNDMIDMLIQVNYLIEFSWQIVDEDFYVQMTGDNLPISMIKDTVGLQAKMNMTRMLNEPVSSIPNAEIPPEELLPGIIEQVNEKLLKYCGVEITNARFAEFAVSEADKMRINRLEKEMEKARLYSAIAKGAIAVQAVKPAPKPQKKVFWLCKCGAQNKTNFCSECGAPKDFDYWICDCGAKNHGKFCMECGRKLEKY